MDPRPVYAAIGRERTKDIFVLENLGARAVLHELARRAHDRGGPSVVRDAFCVTAHELADFVARPADFADVIAQRAEQQRYLDARIPPIWFQGRIPPPHRWAVRADARPVAPGGGAALSHAAIVARELGIPAVLSVPNITSIADGTMLHVDGDAGTVPIG